MAAVIALLERLLAPNPASVQGELPLFEPAAAPVIPLASELLRKPRRKGGMPATAPTHHGCPSPGCRIFVPARRLACSDHWFSLPEDLRNEINRTYKRDVRRHLQLYREAVRLLHLNATREDLRP